jgi:hypothetical protein
MDEEMGGIAATDTGYEATDQEDGGFSYGLDGTDNDPTAEGATDQEGEVSGEPAPDPTALQARIAELEAEAGKYRPYSKLFDMASAIGPPDVFEEKLREQELATQKNLSRQRSEQYIGRASEYARERFASLVQDGEMEDTAATAAEAILHEILGPFADRLADIEPLIARIEHNDKVTMAGRAVAELMKPTTDGGKGFEFMDEDAVRDAIVAGGDYLSVAKRTHERGLQIAKATENRLKASRQEEAIKRGSPASPPVEGVRRQPAPMMAATPNPVSDPEGWRKFREEQKKRMQRGESAY